MYKIALIDDEEIVREGMKELIRWEALGLELVGTAADGESGYELVVECEPEIILTDINMPKCNGLQLAEKVKEEYPWIKIILISGYDEFHYVRQALRMGIEDYVLKPVTRLELEEILEKVVSQLKIEDQKNKTAVDIQNRIEETIPLMQQKVMQELIYHQIDSKLIPRKCMKGNIPYNSPWYGFFLLDPDEQIGDDDYQEKPLTQFAVQNIVTEIIGSSGKGIAFELEGLTAVLYIGDIDSNNEREEVYHKEIINAKEAINELVDIKISIAVGGIVENIEDIYKSYEEAKNVLSQRFFKDIGQVIYGSSKVKYKRASVVDWVKWENYILKDVLDRQKFQDGIKTIGIKMREEKVVLEDMQDIWHHMMCGLVKRFMEVNPRITNEVVGCRNINDELKTIKNIDKIQDWAIELYDKHYFLMQSQASTQSAYVERIKRIIDTHYAQDTFSAKDVCEQIHISPSYLSQIFKKEMGKTFIQYLTEYRIEKAKQLLKQTHLKTYEITERIGYTDSHYFSVIFKKHTGKTPSEYRKY